MEFSDDPIVNTLLEPVHLQILHKSNVILSSRYEWNLGLVVHYRIHQHLILLIIRVFHWGYLWIHLTRDGEVYRLDLRYIRLCSVDRHIPLIKTEQHSEESGIQIRFKMIFEFIMMPIGDHLHILIKVKLIILCHVFHYIMNPLYILLTILIRSHNTISHCYTVFPFWMVASRNIKKLTLLWVFVI